MESSCSIENDGSRCARSLLRIFSTNGIASTTSALFCREALGVSPAFNVDLSSVIFSSKVEDADGAYGDAYKLTLKDNNTKLTVGDVTRDGNTVTVPYQRTDSDSADGITANQVSVLILGSDNAIKYYAPLKSSYSASGTGTFVVPSDVTGSDKVYVFAEEVNSQYLTDYASEMTEITIVEVPEIKNASLTLSDDLGLNFYMTSAITNEDEDLYTVTFDGECLEDGQTVQLAKKEDNKFYATAHVYAKNLEKKITATLCKGDEIIDTKEYSVADYLDSAAETVTDARALALIKATKAFGAVSAEYFYGDDHGFDSAFAAYLTQSNLTESEIVSRAKLNAYTTDFTTDDAKISLVLDSKTAIRLYLKGVQPDESNGLMPSKQANKDEYPSYYEIEGLTPDKLAKEQSVNIDGTTYKFNALAWANRILNNFSASDKNVRMAKAIMAYYLAARDYANTINLASLGTSYSYADYQAKDGEVLTGKLGRIGKISIADGATVTLKDVTIEGVHRENTNNTDVTYYNWAGITCSGNATIILEGENFVRGFYSYNPGIFVPKGKTLTIEGTGSLKACSNGLGTGIGGGNYIDCGNIVIESGVIEATGGVDSAAIGGGNGAEFGNITIKGGTLTVTGGHYSPAIGGNQNGTCGDITIADTVTKVTAARGDDALDSIGPGYCNCGTVTIGGVIYFQNDNYVNGGEEYLGQATIVYEPNQN